MPPANIPAPFCIVSVVCACAAVGVNVSDASAAWCCGVGVVWCRVCEQHAAHSFAQCTQQDHAVCQCVQE
eukprot:m.174274 g.174274  ORF g.174274 m.174274 type:complete len:70 (+) comp53298_c3_seq1:2722-2931(+)